MDPRPLPVTTEAAVRLRCKRAIERIREQQEGEQHES